MFSVLILHKHLSRRQWVSLLILMIGVILVQWQKDNKSSSSEDKFIGFIAVFISSISSGFSGVYFEKLIKFNTQSLWTRNTQLSIVSCVFSLFTILTYDYENISSKGFLYVSLQSIKVITFLLTFL